MTKRPFPFFGECFLVSDSRLPRISRFPSAFSLRRKTQPFSRRQGIPRVMECEWLMLVHGWRPWQLAIGTQVLPSKKGFSKLFRPKRRDAPITCEKMPSTCSDFDPPKAFGNSHYRCFISSLLSCLSCLFTIRNIMTMINNMKNKQTTTTTTQSFARHVAGK